MAPLSLPPEARCPAHGEALQVGPAEASVRGECGCIFPIRLGIPRFVPDGGYAHAFGLQWNEFRKTQLDSYSRTTISRDRLTRCIGGSLEPLRGKSVLEVGCGAGRFTEVLLDAGARVFACDLSAAVEANLANCGPHPDYFVCQADVMALPVAPRSFDFVIALGMVQHTPSPEKTIEALAAVVRPGGLLVLDHYRALGPFMRLLNPFMPRTILRAILLRLPAPLAFRATNALVRVLLPLHRLLWRRGFVADGLRSVWRRASPVFDYYDAFPELGGALADWARLDTHDGLTDYYKHRRSPREIARALSDVGLEVIDSRAGGNGVEARGRRPFRPHESGTPVVDCRSMRYVAFLRAINVGGSHVVKMDILREIFEGLGFAKVETFIASGNVIFETRSKTLAAVERKIEKALKEALGFEVVTFIRSLDDLVAMTHHQPFPPQMMASAVALNVGLLKEPLSAAAKAALPSLKTEVDAFHTHGSELYWICLKRQSESRVSNAVFERVLKLNATFRGMRTLEKLLAKHRAD